MLVEGREQGTGFADDHVLLTNALLDVFANSPSGGSFPLELSLLAATKPEVLRALARIHAEELARHCTSAAKRSGEAGKLHAGAVTFVQRFGSSLNVHVHLHTCALDGVYVEEEEEEDVPRFVPALAPSRAELYVLTERVALRVMTWLRKPGHLKADDHASNDTPERSFAELLAQLATQRGTLENVKDDTGECEGPAKAAAPLRDEAVTRHGLNLHASLTIAAEDDLGRERLCRYGLPDHREDPPSQASGSRECP